MTIQLAHVGSSTSIKTDDDVVTNTSWDQWSEKVSEVVNKNFIIIYHDKCLDGAVAASLMAYTLELAFRPMSVQLVPMSYGDKFTPNDGRWPINAFVIMVDFSLPLVELNFMQGFFSGGVLVIDHHYSFTKSFLPVGDHNNLFSFFVSTDPVNESDAGGSLVQKFVTPFLNETTEHTHDQRVNIDRFVQLAKYHDLWLHDGNPEYDAMALSYWFSNMTAATPFDMVHLMNKVMLSFELQQAVVLEGRTYLDKAVDEITTMLNENKKEIIIDGFPVFVCECPKKYGSLAATILNTDRPYSVTWIKREDGKFEYSLRSSRKRNFNCGQLATFMGGGGHRRAAGFVSDKPYDKVFELVGFADAVTSIDEGNMKVSTLVTFNHIRQLLKQYNFVSVKRADQPRFESNPEFDLVITRKFAIQTKAELNNIRQDIISVCDMLEPAEHDRLRNKEGINATMQRMEESTFPFKMALELKLSDRCNTVRIYQHGAELQWFQVFNQTEV